MFNFRKTTLFPTEEANNTKQKRKIQEENKVKEQRKIGKRNHSQCFRSTRSGNLKKKSYETTVFINKRHLKVLTRSAVRAGKTTCKQLWKMAGSNVCAAEIACTGSVLHTKTNASTAVESHCERRTAVCRTRCGIFRSLQFKLLTSSE
jgi:hypothetical protein